MDKITREEAIDFLKNDRRFQVLLWEMVEMRESAITELGKYETDVSLRKAAAEVTVYTELLDMFGVPAVQPGNKAPEA